MHLDRHRAADVHPRHGGDGEGEDPAFRQEGHQARRHLRHQRCLSHRQPPQSRHADAADLPTRRAGRLLLLHGALARYRRPDRRHEHGYLFGRPADPDHEISGSRRGQSDAGRDDQDERAAAEPRHGRSARTGHGGEDRRAAFPATDRALRPRAGARIDQGHHGPRRGHGAFPHAHDPRRRLRGRILHGRRRRRGRQEGADQGARGGARATR